MARRSPAPDLPLTLTSASWLNAVEGFFSTITRRKIRRGVFTSAPELEAEIAPYIKTHNKSATPFVWTKPPTVILRQARGNS